MKWRLLLVPMFWLIIIDCWYLPSVIAQPLLSQQAQPVLVKEGERVPPLPQVKALIGHSLDVLSVSFSPNGKSVVSGSGDGTVRLWDIASGKELLTLGHEEDYVWSVSFSPDGQYVASVSQHETVRLWDLASGKELHTLSGHSRYVFSVDFSPDGKSVISGSSDGTVKLWDVASGQELRTLSSHSSGVRSASFSPDGQSVISGSEDGAVLLWDLVSGQELRKLNGHSGRVWSVSFSPDGQSAVSGSEDTTVRLWNIPSGEQIRTLSGHSGRVQSVSFSPDGKSVVSGSGDGTVRLWDIASGEELRTLSGHSSDIWSVSFSPDGHSVISGSSDNTVRLWDLVSGQELRTLSDRPSVVRSVNFSPNGKRVVASSGDDTVRLWDIASGQELRTLSGHSGDVWSVSFSPDGHSVVSGSEDTTVRLWDVTSGQELRTFSGHSGSVQSVSFSPDRKRVVSGSSDRTVRLWDTTSGQELRTLSGHSGAVWSVSFSPDGHSVVSGSSDGTVRLWDTTSGQKLRTLSGHSGAVWSVSFSPDGHSVVSGSSDGTVRLWDVASGQKLRTFSGHSSSVQSVRFSTDGKHVVSGSSDNTVRLWDVVSGKELQTLSGHSGAVRSVSFSPDGNSVVSGSSDNTVRLWDVASGLCLAELRGFRNGVWTFYQADGVLYRGDTGIGMQIVTRSSYFDEFKPLMPPKPTTPAQLRVSIAENEITVPTGKGVSYAQLSIENLTNSPAYWLQTLPTNLPAGFNAVMREHSRLDGKDTTIIPLAITYFHSLDKNNPDQNPKEFDTMLSFELSSAYTDPTPFEIPVKVQVATPEAKELRLLTDDQGETSAVEFKITNTGQQDPEGLQVEVEFLEPETNEIIASTQPLTVGSIPPGATAEEPLAFALPQKVRDRGDEVNAKIIMIGNISPTHRWTSIHPLELSPPWAFYTAIIALALLLFTGGFFYQLVFRNSTVTAFAADPSTLRTLPSSQAVLTDRRLRRARRLSGLLSNLDIPESRWTLLLQSSDQPATALAKALDAKLSSEKKTRLTKELTLYPLQLPEMPLRIETNTALLVLTGENVDDLPNQLDRTIESFQLSNSYLLLIDRTSSQKAAAQLQDSFLKVIVINDRELTSIILSAEPKQALSRIIARSADLGDISPYQTGGGVDNPALFFGRRNEVALLAGREARNHLLIGARQIGKSSVLKSLQRRYPGKVYFITLTGTDLDSDFKRQHGATLDELVANAASDKPLLFLLDEADDFVEAEREQNYPQLRHFRALSEANRCRFVLAGFWQLHHAAYLEHQSPIRNFAEPIPLGPLDEEAARNLATKPLQPLGIRFASDALIAELLQRSGCRPNLIARACDAALRRLPPLAERVITEEMLHAVLDVADDSGKNIAQAFGDIGALTKDKRSSAIDRMVMYATVEEENFNLTEARQRLQSVNARVPVEELRESLDRLALAYVIKLQSGRYFYPVPLLKDYLFAQSDGDPASMLESEADDWRDEFARG